MQVGHASIRGILQQKKQNAHSNFTRRKAGDVGTKLSAQKRLTPRSMQIGVVRGGSA